MPSTTLVATPRPPLFPLKWTLIYLVLIPLVNWAFSWAPMWQLPDGGAWTPFAIITGLVLVFRDFAQRAVGHRIFIALALGAAMSFVMAPAEIALASGLAFLISESTDWAVYTLSQKPLSQRIMLSSCRSAPLDTMVFLLGANMAVPGLFSRLTAVSAIASKLVGAWVVSRLVRHSEQRRTMT